MADKKISNSSDTGLEYTTHPLNVSLKENDATTTIKRTGNLREMLKEHKETYSGKIHNLDWKEKLLAVPRDYLLDSFGEIDLTELDFIPTTSYEAQATRNGAKTGIAICGVVALFETQDNDIMLGVRTNGTDGAVGILPAGYLTYHASNPIFATFYAETEEELGVHKKEIEQLEVIGYNTLYKPRRIHIVLYGKTNLRTEEIIRRHEDAYKIHETTIIRLKNKGRGHSRARNVSGRYLARRGFLNTHVGEHKIIFPISNDQKTIDKIIREGKVSVNGNTHNVFPMGLGALELYRQHIYR